VTRLQGGQGERTGGQGKQLGVGQAISLADAGKAEHPLMVVQGNLGCGQLLHSWQQGLELVLGQTPQGCCIVDPNEHPAGIGGPQPLSRASSARRSAAGHAARGLAAKAALL
jgi:hypothetical protein